MSSRILSDVQPFRFLRPSLFRKFTAAVRLVSLTLTRTGGDPARRAQFPSYLRIHSFRLHIFRAKPIRAPRTLPSENTPCSLVLRAARALAQLEVPRRRISRVKRWALRSGASNFSCRCSCDNSVSPVLSFRSRGFRGIHASRAACRSSWRRGAPHRRSSY